MAILIISNMNLLVKFQGRSSRTFTKNRLGWGMAMGDFEVWNSFQKASNKWSRQAPQEANGATMCHFFKEGLFNNPSLVGMEYDGIERNIEGPILGLPWFGPFSCDIPFNETAWVRWFNQFLTRLFTRSLKSSFCNWRIPTASLGYSGGYRVMCFLKRSPGS